MERAELCWWSGYWQWGVDVSFTVVHATKGRAAVADVLGGVESGGQDYPQGTPNGRKWIHRRLQTSKTLHACEESLRLLLFDCTYSVLLCEYVLSAVITATSTRADHLRLCALRSNKDYYLANLAFVIILFTPFLLFAFARCY